MRNILKYFFALLIATSICVAADVPWKGKPYEQWSEKDLEKIFSDSPWARISTITRTWNSASGGAATPASGNDAKRPAGGAGPSARGPQGGGSNAPEADDVNFYVHWVSSRVMRAASAKRAALRGQSGLDISKYATQPQEEYQISVQSEDMSPFARHDESFYQKNSFLEAKKSKNKIAPSQVRFERDASGAVTTAIFFFPKKNAAGEVTIPAEEKNIEFNCKIEGATLRVTFEPQKMVDNLGSDL